MSLGASAGNQKVLALLGSPWEGQIAIRLSSYAAIQTNRRGRRGFAAAWLRRQAKVIPLRGKLAQDQALSARDFKSAALELNQGAMGARLFWPALTLALALATLSRSASAFERQWHFGGGIGAASYSGTESGIAPALGLHAAYGVSDMFDARVELLGSHHSTTDDRSLDVYSAAAGIAYKLDVIEWIPYAGLLAGYYYFNGEPAPEFRHDFALSALLGLDYAWSRNFGVGVALRYHGFMLDAPRSFTDAAYFTGLARAEYRFGW